MVIWHNRIPELADPVAHRNQILLQLAECLITDEGKRKASSILGIRTFNEMYQKIQRQQAVVELAMPKMNLSKAGKNPSEKKRENIFVQMEKYHQLQHVEKKTDKYLGSIGP